MSFILIVSFRATVEMARREPTFQDENGDDIDTSFGTLTVVKPRVSSYAALLPLDLGLAGCASPTSSQFETPLSERIPASLLTCRDRPLVEGPLDRQSDVARWIVELDAAGADCRSKVEAVKDVVEGDVQTPGE